MDITALHTATETFASYLSEVTAGDLGFPTPCEGWDVADLYHHVLGENVRFGLAVSEQRVGHDAPADLAPLLDASAAADSAVSRGALDVPYRRSAAFMEGAFTSTDDPALLRQVAGVPGPRTVRDLYDMQLCDTVIHTWDLAQAIGLECEIEPELAGTVLRRMEQVPDSARGDGKAFGPARTSARAAVRTPPGVLERIVLLSGRAYDRG